MKRLLQTGGYLFEFETKDGEGQRVNPKQFVQTAFQQTPALDDQPQSASGKKQVVFVSAESSAVDDHRDDIHAGKRSPRSNSNNGCERGRTTRQTRGMRSTQYKAPKGQANFLKKGEGFLS